MVSTKLKSPMFYFNARDIQKQSSKDVEVAARRCFKNMCSQYSRLNTSCEPKTCNFMKEEVLVQVFCCESILCRTTDVPGR